jgi:hypothetical protein
MLNDPRAIQATIEAVEGEIGAPIGIVVFDTLSSNFGAGDESQTADMRTAMANVRKACGERAVIVVHHVGHAEKGRERGAYALRGDSDRRIKVELAGSGETIHVTCEKAKDDLPFAAMAFQWRVVELGWLDCDGEMLTSLVLESAQYQPDPKQQREPSGDLQKAVMQTLRAHGAGMRRKGLAEALSAHDASNVYRAIRNLIQAEVLVDVAGVIGIRGNEKV